MVCQVKQKYKNLDVKVATDNNVGVIFLHHPLPQWHDPNMPQPNLKALQWKILEKAEMTYNVERQKNYMI